jgi:GT2 family glycosyltransferase
MAATAAAPVMGFTSERPAVSIVIPTYNGRALLERCLESLARHAPVGLRVEVIVADDASTDGTAGWLCAAWPEVVLVASAENRGFAATANAGIALARAPIVQMLNNDTEVCAGWLTAGLEPFADPRTGSVAPLVLLRSDPAVVDSAGDVLTLYGRAYKRGRGQPAARGASRPAEVVPGASASAAFYRADALRAVGGFDVDYGSYFEDVDLACRLRWAGYRCLYVPRCRVLHDVSATFDHGSHALQRRLSRNAEYLFWSNATAGGLALGLLPHVLYLLGQAVLRAGRGGLPAFLRGKAEALAVAGRIAAKRRQRRALVGLAQRLGGQAGGGGRRLVSGGLVESLSPSP